MRTKRQRSNRSPEVPEQLRNSSPAVLSDPTGEVSPVIVAKATLAEEPIWSGQAYPPLGSDSMEGLELRSCSGTSGERLDRGGFVLMDLEHAVQFGGFQQIEDVDRGL